MWQKIKKVMLIIGAGFVGLFAFLGIGGGLRKSKQKRIDKVSGDIRTNIDVGTRANTEAGDRITKSERIAAEASADLSRGLDAIRKAKKISKARAKPRD